MQIVVIDYGSGNLRSAARAAERAAVENGIEAHVSVTGAASDIARADRIILPGQGAFGDCIGGLKSLPGMVDALTEQVREKRKPFLGICVGMQLLADRGFEHGEHAGLGWIGGNVTPLRAGNLKIPHMGWNTLDINQSGHPALAGVASGDHVYFVHSFKFDCTNNADIVASCGYGETFAAIVARDNILGMQFHPEKSQKTGLQLMQNFLRWDC